MTFHRLLYGGQQLWCYSLSPEGQIVRTYRMQDFGVGRESTVHQAVRLPGAGRRVLNLQANLAGSCGGG
eukprot:3689910-Karenia_brevis.AAC.1